MSVRKMKTLLLSGVLCCVFLSACSPFRRDPGLPLWSPISPMESLILRDVRKKQSAENLFKLSLILSGARTKGNIKPLVKQYKKLVSALTPLLKAETDRKKRAALLLKELHRRLFKTQLRPYKSRYSFNQTRIDTSFRQGSFNCMSSAVIYGILAYHFGYEVQGVSLPGHVFVQLTAGQGQAPWEVETTVPSGFAQKHDEAYYKKKKPAPKDAPPDYKPTSFQEYKRREIISLFSLVTYLSNVQHTHKKRMNSETRNSLREIAGMLDKKPEIQANRLYVWNKAVRIARDNHKWKEAMQILEIAWPESQKALKFALSKKKWDKHLAQNFSSLASYTNQIYAHHNQWNKAEKAWKLYKTVYPHLKPASQKRAPLIVRSMGYALWSRMLKAGERKRAKKSMTALVALLPQWRAMLKGTFWYAKGNTYFSRSRYIQARKAYATCVQETQPSPHPDCIRSLRIARQNQKINERNQKISLTNQLGRLLNDRKWKKSYVLMKELAELLKAPTNLHRTLKSNVSAYLQNAMSGLGGDEKYKQAMLLLKRSKVLLPNGEKPLMGAFYNALGGELIRQQYYDKAIAAYKRCIQASTPSYAKVCRSNIEIAERRGN